jgi:hypothetical protein
LPNATGTFRSSLRSLARFRQPQSTLATAAPAPRAGDS